MLVPNVSGANQNLEDIENELNDNIHDRLDELDLEGLDFFDKYLENNGIFDGGVSELIDAIISGKFNSEPTKVLEMILALFGVSLKGFLPVMITIIAISIIFSIINNLSSGFTSKSTTEVIYFVCYSAMIVLVIGGISHLVVDTVKTINNMAKLMEVIFPITITLVTALGGVVSSGIYSPLMAMLSMGISSIIKGVVLPCFIATMALTIVGYISKNVRLDKLTKFFKSSGTFILGFVFSVFASLVTLQGITGAVSDNISIKSAKFAISSYVPILGGYLSDGFDLVMASVVLVKNAVGMCGVVIVLSMVLAPVINIALYILGLRLVSGIIEPIADKRMSKILYGISENLTLLISVLLGMAFMFFLMMTLVILTCSFGV